MHQKPFSKLREMKQLKGLPKKVTKKEIKIREQERIAKYQKFLKTNYDWGYYYIIDILRFKIKMTRKFITKNSYVIKESIDVISSQMLEVESLLKKIVDDKYQEELDKEFEIKYTCKVKIKFKFKKDNRLVLKRKFKGINSELADEADAEYNQLHDRAFEMKKADLKKAFELISENIWGWWE